MTLGNYVHMHCSKSARCMVNYNDSRDVATGRISENVAQRRKVLSTDHCREKRVQWGEKNGDTVYPFFH